MRGCPEKKELVDEEGHGLRGDFGQDEGSWFLELEGQGQGWWRMLATGEGESQGGGVGEGHLFWGHS